MSRLLLLTVLIASPALADPPPSFEPDADEIFSKFKHKKHDKHIEAVGMGCPACHQMGGTANAELRPDQLDDLFLTPPRLACHYCHNPPAAPQPKRTKAPGKCTTCHELLEAPVSHGAGWMLDHGPEARLGGPDCSSCHQKRWCIDCHERKNAVTFAVHDRTWISVHGMAARTNPTECVTCHLQVDCVRCHATNDGRLR